MIMKKWIAGLFVLSMLGGFSFAEEQAKTEKKDESVKDKIVVGGVEKIKEAKDIAVKELSAKEVAIKESIAKSEERGVWFNRSEMFVPKEKIVETLDKYVKANLNTVYIDAYFKGGVPYNGSQFVPAVEEVQKFDFDIMQFIIEECHKRGIRAEAWVEYGFYAYHTQDATKDKSRGALLDKNPELTSVTDDGKTFLHNQQWGDFYSLCPSNPKSHEILINIFKEIITKYDFDGLNLDRIRYPEKHYCFCDYCKENFKKDVELDLKTYPDGSPEYAKIVAWRKEQLTKFMSNLSKEIRAAKKGIIITSAVVPVELMDEKAQDWFTWLDRGYLDAAIPMLYGDSVFSHNINQIKTKFGKVNAVFAGLGADTNSPEATAKQIDKARAEGLGGVVFWYSGKIDDDLSLLQEKQFKDKALSNFPLLKKIEAKAEKKEEK